MKNMWAPRVELLSVAAGNLNVNRYFTTGAPVFCEEGWSEWSVVLMNLISAFDEAKEIRLHDGGGGGGRGRRMSGIYNLSPFSNGELISCCCSYFLIGGGNLLGWAIN